MKKNYKTAKTVMIVATMLISLILMSAFSSEGQTITNAFVNHIGPDSCRIHGDYTGNNDPNTMGYVSIGKDINMLTITSAQLVPVGSGQISFGIDGLEPGTTYYAKVRIWNSSMGTPTMSAQLIFLTTTNTTGGGDISAKIMLNADTICDDKVKIFYLFTCPDSGALTQICYSQGSVLSASPEVTAPVIRGIGNNTLCNVMVTNLDAGTYNFAVRIIPPHGGSAVFSDTVKITFTKPSGIGDVNTKKTEVKIFPNPVLRGENIIIVTEKEMEIDFYDLTGKKVKSVEAGEGRNSLANDLSAGLYIFSYNNGKEIKSGKFIVNDH